MGTQATLVYTLTPIGATQAQLIALANAAAVPVPRDFLRALGLRVTSDATPAASPVVRTVVLAFDPSAPATIAAMTLNSAGEITTVVANPGLDYILPPILAVTGNTASPAAPQPDLQAFLNVQSTAMDLPGAGYVAPIVTFIGGLPPANGLGTLSQPPSNELPNPEFRPPIKFGCVMSIRIKKKGLNYPIGTTVSLRGGGIDGSTPAVPAQAVLTLDSNGRVADIQLVDMGVGYVKRPDVVLQLPVGFVPTSDFQEAQAFAGMAEGTPARAGVITLGGGGTITNIALAVGGNGDGYIGLPDILIRDAIGTGATAHARMGVGRIDIRNAGRGVPATAGVSFTPVFQAYFPSTVGGNDPNQRRPFFRLLEAAISQSAFSPVVSSDPVVA